MSSSKKLLQSASGFINQSGSLNIEDVFSTHVYRGTGADGNQIVNGIDLANEGGMVWIKLRHATNGGLMDTARGVGKIFNGTYNNNAEQTENSGKGLVSFNNNGFTLNQEWHGSTNAASDYVSYTFRKAPKFFDVVTGTTDNSGHIDLTHNLEQEPGMVIYKRRDMSNNWFVYHRSLGVAKYLNLDTNGVAANFTAWANVTSTTFRAQLGLGSAPADIVAYFFGHDTSDEGMIQCGEFTTDSNGDYDGLDDLGWEPQWIMVKGYEHSGILTSWIISDHVRGLNTGDNDKALLADQSGAEFSQEMFDIGAEGFKIHNFPNSSASGKFIYMAIRRGPMATPTARANVFSLDTVAYTGSNSWIPAFASSNFADLAIVKNRTTTENIYISSRIQGLDLLVTNSNGTEVAGSGVVEFDYMEGAWVNAQNNGRGAYVWSRAPGFCDVVTYTGNGSAGRQINHNLGATPEMIWLKLRDSYTDNWMVYHSGLATNNNLILDRTDATGLYTRLYSPSETIFTVSSDTSVNSNGLTYIAYLFATLAGISKVGTFSHTNGSTTDVNCGFSSGTYWVVVKRKDSTGDWFVFDVGANIGASNDPYIALNSNAAAVTTPNYIAQLNSGFTMESDFPTGDYIFYAIAN